jgi:tryptophan synthase alpha chain
MAGITGTKPIETEDVEASVAALRARTALPVTVGFGIRTPEQAGRIARFSDGVVVGTAIVEQVYRNVNAPRAELVAKVAEFCAGLADSVHAARSKDV